MTNDEIASVLPRERAVQVLTGRRDFLASRLRFRRDHPADYPVVVIHRDAEALAAVVDRLARLAR